MKPKASPLTCKAIASPSKAPPATDAFRAARGAALSAWVAEARQNLDPPRPPPGGVDLPALNALVFAAVEDAAILGPAGMAPGSQKIRARRLPELRRIVAASHPGPTPT